MNSFIEYVLAFFIAAVSAFIAAYFVSKLLDLKNRKNRIDEAKKNIETELEFICTNMLYPYGTDEITDEEIYFSTPIWNTVISNGYILTIRKNEDFFNAALASYRQLELLRKNEDRINWDNLSPNERVDIINERRRVRTFVENNINVIKECLEKGSKKNKTGNKTDDEYREGLKLIFKDIIANDTENGLSIGEGEDEYIFNKRNIEKKGVFFQTARLKEVFNEEFGYEAKYGIGFGKYDCEIYLLVWNDKDTSTETDVSKILTILPEKGESKKILHTYYDHEINGKIRVSNNYSRLVLASTVLGANAYTGKYTLSTIEKPTINKMIKELLNFENEWLSKTE